MAGQLQVPTLQRIDAPAPASEGRINFKEADPTKPMAEATTAINNFGHEGIKLEQHIEDMAIDTEKTKVGADFEINRKTQLEKIKNQDGDPTKLYSDFDQETKKQYDDILSNESYSSRMKDQVSKHLADINNHLMLQRSIQEENQQSLYIDNVSKARVKLDQDNLVAATTVIKGDDPSTFAPYDDTVGRIRNTILMKGMKTGTVIPDENGKTVFVGDDGKPMRVNVLPQADYEIKKSLSDGIYNSMDNLIKSGQLDAAKALREKYGDYIEPVKKKNIADDFDRAETKADAYEAVGQVIGKGPEAIKKAFSSLKPEAQDEAYKILDDRQRRQENIKNRQSKQNYDGLMNHINDVMRSDTPYAGVTELENDPAFASAIRNVSDAKQRKALYDMVQQPKDTPDAVKSKLQNLFAGNDEDHPDIRQMTPSEFNQYLSGASKADRTRYTRKFESWTTENGAQEATRYRATNKTLTDELILSGYINRDNFNRISGDDEKKLILARDEMDQYLNARGSTPMSQKEMTEYARNFALSKAKGETFKPPTPVKFQGSRNDQTPNAGSTPTSAGSNANSRDAAGNDLIKGKTRMGWVKEFQKQNGKMPNLNTNELQKFIDGQP